MNQKYKKFNIKNSQKGYAILFAVVVVSIITLITVGLSNTTYKQLVLSSLANDSEQAFYQADTATECALYADNVVGMTASTPSFSCGKDSKGNDMSFKISNTTGGQNDYSLVPTIEDTHTPIPCFDFNVVKTTSPSTTTNIFARGYNSCDLNNPKTVEREINVTYQ